MEEHLSLKYNVPSSLASKITRKRLFENKNFILTIGLILVSLSSSLYYNWAPLELIFVNQRLFDHLCTDADRSIATNDVFVCDNQRKMITTLFSVILYTETSVSWISGLISDYYGPLVTNIIGFVFGIFAFTLLWIFPPTTFVMIIFSMAWGISGSFVFYGALQYPRLYRDSQSIVYSEIIFADNFSMIWPVFMWYMVKRYNVKHYMIFVYYMLIVTIPCLLIALFFLPNNIIPIEREMDIDIENTSVKSNKNLLSDLHNVRYWLCTYTFTVVFLVNTYFKRSFSTYYNQEQELTEFMSIFTPFQMIIGLFIGLLNHYIGVLYTTSFIMLFYISSFICFLCPNHNSGYVSIVLFNIASSVDIQQTLSYIGWEFPDNNATLMGIGQLVCSLVGFIVQYNLDYIYDTYGPFIVVTIISVTIFSVIGVCMYLSFTTKNSDKCLGSPLNKFLRLSVALISLPTIVLLLYTYFLNLRSK